MTKKPPDAPPMTSKLIICHRLYSTRRVDIWQQKHDTLRRLRRRTVAPQWHFTDDKFIQTQLYCRCATPDEWIASHSRIAFNTDNVVPFTKASNIEITQKLVIMQLQTQYSLETKFKRKHADQSILQTWQHSGSNGNSAVPRHQNIRHNIYFSHVMTPRVAVSYSRQQEMNKNCSSVKSMKQRTFWCASLNQMLTTPIKYRETFKHQDNELRITSSPTRFIRQVIFIDI